MQRSPMKMGDDPSQDQILNGYVESREEKSRETGSRLDDDGGPLWGVGDHKAL